MKCPLFLAKMEFKSGLYDINMLECLKEECAWWEETQGLCSVKNMGRMLGFISQDMTQMLEKMPAAGISRK